MCVLFSPEILQAGAVKRFNVGMSIIVTEFTLSIFHHLLIVQLTGR